MKVYRKITIDIDTLQVIEEDSFEYDGPVALLCGDDGGSDSDSDSSSSGGIGADTDTRDGDAGAGTGGRGTGSSAGRGGSSDSGSGGSDSDSEARGELDSAAAHNASDTGVGRGRGNTDADTSTREGDAGAGTGSRGNTSSPGRDNSRGEQGTGTAGVSRGVDSTNGLGGSGNSTAEARAELESAAAHNASRTNSTTTEGFGNVTSNTMETSLTAAPSLFESLSNYATNAINSIRGMFSDEDETSFANYETRMGFMEQEKAYSNLASLRDQALADQRAGILSDDTRTALHAAMQNYMDTYEEDLPNPVEQGFLTDRYNTGPISRALNNLGIPTDVPSLVSFPFNNISGKVLGGVLGSTLGPGGALAGMGVGAAIGNMVSGDVRSDMAATEAMESLGLGNAPREGNASADNAGVSAANDAAGGYGSGNREEDNVMGTRAPTNTPDTNTPETPTNTGPTDTTLPVDDLIDSAWQRFYAFQNAGPGTYNTNYYQRGPYAIRRESLGDLNTPPDYFSLF